LVGIGQQGENAVEGGVRTRQEKRGSNTKVIRGKGFGKATRKTQSLNIQENSKKNNPVAEMRDPTKER